MITDTQLKKFKKYLRQGKSLKAASAMSGINEKTGRKYRNISKLPSDLRVECCRYWRTRDDPFEDVWEKSLYFLENNQGLEAKTLFAYLQRKNPGCFSGGQLRTFQRRVKAWRATADQCLESSFPKNHQPGSLSSSSFANLSNLQISVAGRPFDHLVYHFVLIYSNWETASVCLSESFESLSKGLQKSLWELGGVPQFHHTCRFPVPMAGTETSEECHSLYRQLLDHYQLFDRPLQQALLDEIDHNESQPYRFKKALDHALILRDSRDFKSLEEYEAFLQKLIGQLNQCRQIRLREEQNVLHTLPSRNWP